MTDGEIVVIIRPSFKKLCGKNAQAAALNHILYWIARKKKDGGEYWYCTGEDLYHTFLEEFGINALRAAVKDLIARGFIGEARNPDPKRGYDRTKHFYFQEEQARALFTAFTEHGICPYCKGLPQEVLDLFTPHFTLALNASHASVKCLCEKHLKELPISQQREMHFTEALDAFHASVTTSPKITPKITDKERALSSEKGDETPFTNEIPPGEEARPPNTRQQRAFDTQFEEAVWSLWTARIGHKINVAARRKPGNYEGLVVLRDYSLPDIELALKRASTFTVQSTNMSNLAKDIDGLLGNSQQVKELTQQQLAKNGHRPPRDPSYAQELRRSWTHKERNPPGNGEHTPT